MQGFNKWQMQYLSQALTRAKRLEKKREDYYKKVYASILYPSVQLDQSLMREHSHATDAQAIRLIDMKERYDRRIQREYKRHVRWESILEWVDESDRIILIRYFQKKKHVQPKIINRILNRIEKRLEEQERQIEKELDAVAVERYKELSKHREAVTPLAEEDRDKDKRRYLVNGEFILMTTEEYTTQKDTAL